MASYFLFKSDPETYSLDDLERDQTTVWDGVHNAQAIIIIKTMKVGDLVYLYHSQKEKAVVGMAEVIKEPFEDTSGSRKSWAVEIKFIKRFEISIPLKEFKAEVDFARFPLVSNGRLSVMPVPEKIQKWIDQKVA